MPLVRAPRGELKKSLREIMQDAGFLGTAAPLAADITLLLEMGMGAGLLAGALLARAGRIRYHAACQATIVLLNLVLIGLTMVPTFHRLIFPRLPSKIGKPYYALATAHGGLGSVAELGGLYIMLAAGTNLLPEKFRIKRYKFWMRSVLLVWWTALLLGMATYTRWYVTVR
jgi:uncharacterized membrane protein YozB (DUF420 family)